MELYKKYRPKKWDEVLGCEETVRALRNMVERKTLPHTILFHGPSGCGKTTLARMLVSALGCSDIDFVEANSAGYRGIDTVRDMQQTMALSPAAGNVRIWLLDEVHKLSNDAQNAALKMLEDTPKHVYFLLCTTDPQKLIKPILTRCCEMPVRALTYDELAKLCVLVCKAEGIKLSNDVQDDLVASAQGSARTLLVLLDKVSNLPDGERAAAIASKMEQESEGIELCRLLIKRAKWRQIAEVLRNLKTDAEQIRWAVLGYARTVLLKNGEHQAYLVIDVFSKPFYESKDAGLAAACFEAVHGE